MSEILRSAREPASPPDWASSMTWLAAITVMVVLVSGFVFAFVLIVVADLAYWPATLITVVLVVVVVSLLLPGTGDGAVRRRLAAVARAFVTGGGAQ